MMQIHKHPSMGPLVTVFGGTGFLGRRVVSRLTQDGAMVRVAVRHPERVDAGRDQCGRRPRGFGIS